MGKTKNEQKILTKTPDGKRHVGDLSTDGRMILKWNVLDRLQGSALDPCSSQHALLAKSCGDAMKLRPSQES
jgi:hypothetical protein